MWSKFNKFPGRLEIGNPRGKLWKLQFSYTPGIYIWYPIVFISKFRIALFIFFTIATFTFLFFMTLFL